jgi:hypothetical protein
MCCRDKDTPNALATYHKVMISIFSAIDEEDLAEQFELAYMNGDQIYKKDITAQQRESDAKRTRPTRDAHR